jgi:hypothetical protein
MLSSLMLQQGSILKAPQNLKVTENILTLLQSKLNPNKYSYGTHDSTSTILTTDAHIKENVSEHGHVCIF